VRRIINSQPRFNLDIYQILRVAEDDIIGYDSLMKAKIYRPARSAMQSGLAKTRKWVLEFESETPRVPDALMGWSSGGDTAHQVRLKFDSLKDAKAFAEQNGMDYTEIPMHDYVPAPRNYGDNFKYWAPEED